MTMLSPDVQMQLLRPQQVEARARMFPVIYVPFGPIEWHGQHLPLGTDALKAHGNALAVARGTVATVLQARLHCFS